MGEDELRASEGGGAMKAEDDDHGFAM